MLNIKAVLCLCETRRQAAIPDTVPASHCSALIFKLRESSGPLSDPPTH